MEIPTLLERIKKLEKLASPHFETGSNFYSNKRRKGLSFVTLDFLRQVQYLIDDPGIPRVDKVCLRKNLKMKASHRSKEALIDHYLSFFTEKIRPVPYLAYNGVGQDREIFITEEGENKLRYLSDILDLDYYFGLRKIMGVGPKVGLYGLILVLLIVEQNEVGRGITSKEVEKLGRDSFGPEFQVNLKIKALIKLGLLDRKARIVACSKETKKLPRLLFGEGD